MFTLIYVFPVTESFPLLLILTGVLGGVVVIVAVTMVVILCQRKVKKPQGKYKPKRLRSQILNFNNMVGVTSNVNFIGLSNTQAL